jgi:hypothetical protein
VLNEEVNGQRFYPVEKQLESFSKFYTNTYVVLVLDCCREFLPEEAMRGGFGNLDDGEKPINKPI